MTVTGLVFDRSGATIGPGHYAALWLWLGWLFIYLIFLVTLPISYQPLRIPWILFVILIIISALFSVNRKAQPHFTVSLGAWILNKAADYFQLKVILEDSEAISKAGPSIFVLEPHGVLPLGIFALSDVVGALRGHRGIGCISSACFLVPLMRHVFTW
jgi:hypothetical protein